MKVQTMDDVSLIEGHEEYFDLIVEHVGPAFIGIGGIGLGICILALVCGVTGIGLFPASIFIGGLGLFLKNKFQ